jgi:hypothetical protein
MKQIKNTKFSFYILVFLFFSCEINSVDESKIKNYPLLIDSLTKSIKIESFETNSFSYDYIYPRHSYLVLSGSNNELQSYIKRIGLLTYSPENVKANTSKTLQEYNAKELWSINGFELQEKDSLIRVKIGMPLRGEAQYAAYFNSAVPNKVFQDFHNNWNGKIVAYVVNEKCVLFIDELSDPTFKRGFK